MPEKIVFFQCIKSLKMGFCEEQKSLKSDDIYLMLDFIIQLIFSGMIKGSY